LDEDVRLLAMELCPQLGRRQAGLGLGGKRHTGLLTEAELPGHVLDRRLAVLRVGAVDPELRTQVVEVDVRRHRERAAQVDATEGARAGVAPEAASTGAVTRK